jgi:hypothetical protein
MNFEEFQSQSLLYVIGALELEEVDEFERERKKFGKKAEDFVAQCYVLHETFALSLRSAQASAAINERLMSMVRKGIAHAGNAGSAALTTAVSKNKRQQDGSTLPAAS